MLNLKFEMIIIFSLSKFEWRNLSTSDCHYKEFRLSACVYIIDLLVEINNAVILQHIKWKYCKVVS